MKKTNEIPKFRNRGDQFLDVIESEWHSLIIRLCDEINYSTTQFYRSKGIKSVYLPITTGSISSPMGLSSDSLPVAVNIGGVDIYLADSMQFLLEYSTRVTQNGSYYIMPSFRGEKMDKRHLNQFYHSEAEIIGDLDDVMNLVEEYIVYITKSLISKFEEEIKKYTGDIKHLIDLVSKKEISRITFKEALSILSNYEDAITYKEGFAFISNFGEQKLIEIFGGIVWLTHFEKLTVPFYQATCTIDNNNALCADLLFGVGEVVGCGERCLTGKDLISSLNEQKIDHDPYYWYIKMKENYPLKTSGFGMGIERYLLWLFKHDDIRDTQLILRVNGEIQNI